MNCSFPPCLLSPMSKHWSWADFLSDGALFRTAREPSPLPRMLVYFLFYVLLNYPKVEAVLIYIDWAESQQGPNSPLERTLFGIVWSCVSTVIICAWSSVHSNVPPPNPWMARWNRLRLMFWMIIAPELVLAWAVRQF